MCLIAQEGLKSLQRGRNLLSGSPELSEPLLWFGITAAVSCRGSHVLQITTLS